MKAGKEGVLLLLAPAAATLHGLHLLIGFLGAALVEPEWNISLDSSIGS
jgi:hypothetical protein